MNAAHDSTPKYPWPTLSRLPVPAKVLATAVVALLGVAMTGAMAQIIVHDIIPTFFAGQGAENHSAATPPASTDSAMADQRGDLFNNGQAGKTKADVPVRGDLFTSPAAGQIQGNVPQNARGDLLAEAPASDVAMGPMLMENKQFVWLLKWTHIHLFGMSMIFIFMGAVTIFLDLSAATRSWLVALPFAGVLADIAAMWLKTYVSPVFFWLHVPGGGLFGIIFIFVSVKAFKDMWLTKTTDRNR